MRLSRALAIVLLAGLAACAEPPKKELDAAEQALQQARQSDAPRYAPDALKQAEDTLQDAHRKVEAQDYKGAFFAARDATEKAHGAVAQASAAKKNARSNTEMAEAVIQASLDEADAARDEAIKAKTPEKAFEEVDPQAQQIKDGLAALPGMLEKGELLEAQKAAADLKAKAASLPGLYRDAVTKWDEEHPKGKKPAAKK
jgi:hypothetical protein